MADWMSKLSLALHKKPLAELAIPGSHDSGAFYLDVNSPIAPGESAVIKALGRLKIFRKIIYKWSITQTLSIGEQLNQGIRYIDVRTAYLKEKDDFFVVHGLYGLKTSDILEQVKDFISAHPKEVVILDFNHLLNFTASLQERMVALIRNTFKDKLCSATLSANSSLEEILKTGAQVIACYHNDEMTTKYKYLWPGDAIYSPWPNTSSTSKLVDYLNDRYDDLRKDSLNVFQAILTPQTSTVLRHPLGSLRKTLVVKCDKTIQSWLESTLSEKKVGTNIVMCDFADMDRWIEATLLLNTSYCLST